VIQLFRQLLSGRDAALCQLALLGIGLLKEPKAVHDLAEHLFDPSPNVHSAACLALVRLGGKTALDAVSEALLHGDEDLRRAAAEALANDPEEGYPILKEGSRIDDLLVRRAVIFGLQRVREPWAAELLEKMQIEDAQWVVKSAASQAVEENAQRERRLPHPLPPLTQTPWLITFAGERGMGVAPGRAAVDLLLLAMKEGSEEQRLAALDTAGRIAEAQAVPFIKQIYECEKGELREAAYSALWRMAAAGIDSEIVIGDK
jgi:HEAT repeat protein